MDVENLSPSYIIEGMNGRVTTALPQGAFADPSATQTFIDGILNFLQEHF